MGNFGLQCFKFLTSFGPETIVLGSFFFYLFFFPIIYYFSINSEIPPTYAKAKILSATDCYDLAWL